VGPLFPENYCTSCAVPGNEENAAEVKYRTSPGRQQGFISVSNCPFSSRATLSPSLVLRCRLTNYISQHHLGGSVCFQVSEVRALFELPAGQICFCSQVTHLIDFSLFVTNRLQHEEMATQIIDFKSFITRLSIRSETMLPQWATRSYQEVSQDKGDEKLDEQVVSMMPGKETTSQNRTRYIIYGVIVTLLLLLIPIILVHRTQHPRWPSCGDNPTTARERGCSFDLITFAWQMPKCYDAPLVEEFAAWEPWTFWTDEHGNDTVQLEDARKGDAALWLPWQYHVVHCTFVWRQMHRAYEAGWIDEHSRSYHHTTHCQKMLLMDCHDEGRFCILPNDTVVTGADLIYPACEKVDKGYQAEWDGFLVGGTDSYS